MSIRDDIEAAHRSNLTMRLISEKAAALSEAAGWRARYEHLKAEHDDLIAKLPEDIRQQIAPEHRQEP